MNPLSKVVSRSLTLVAVCIKVKVFVAGLGRGSFAAGLLNEQNFALLKLEMFALDSSSTTYMSLASKFIL